MNVITLKELWSHITQDTTALLRQELSLTPVTAKTSARGILDPLQVEVAAWHDDVIEGKTSREDFAQRLANKARDVAESGLTAMGLPRSRRSKLVKSIHDIIVPRFTIALKPAASGAPDASSA
jgi:predicted metal-dependent HD superfamily phosphohydrolase